jgi:hypothetical protein
MAAFVKIGNTFVNLDRVVVVFENASGDLRVELETGESVTASGRENAELLAALRPERESAPRRRGRA